jgi:hypothetical protein
MSAQIPREDFELPEIQFPESPALTSLNEEEFAEVLEMRVGAEGLQSPPAAEWGAQGGSDVPASEWVYPSSSVYPPPAPTTTPAAHTSSQSAYSSPPVSSLTKDELDCYLFAAACRYTYRLDGLTPLPLLKVTSTALLSPPPAPSGYSDLPRAQRDQVFQYLTTRSDVVTDSRGIARWMLRDAERRTALTALMRQGLGPTAVISARQDAMRESPDSPPGDPFPSGSPLGVAMPESIEEALWGAIISGVAPLNLQSRRQLLLTERISQWLSGVSTAVPSPADVAQALARETLLQPFRHLCGYWQDGLFVSTFRGREEERARINDYLGVLAPGSRWNFVKRSVSRLTDSAWQMISASNGSKPLFIHGPGGTGKSTLLAKVLLDHLTAPASEARFPYAYLDFDVSALNAREPLTLLAEAARQLALEYPTSAARWTAAREEWLELSRARQGVNASVRADALGTFAELLNSSETGAGEARRSDTIESLSLSNFRNVTVDDLFERELPFLLVLDTFEEVQYVDRFQVKDVVRFLNELRRFVPNTRTILMGRAPLDDLKSEFNALETMEIEGDAFGSGRTTDFNVIEVALGELEPNDAVEYLTSQGLNDAKFARELVGVIGGSPLSLRIVARMIRDEHIDIKELRKELEPPPNSWFSNLFPKKKASPKAVLQGVLFRRFLNHIHEEKIKELAHPGLVLRRITPDIIREVLAGPCELGEVSPEQAEQYFQSLAREVSLVGTDYEVTGPVLVHRPDLRRVMLRLMQSDEAMLDKIRRIHEGAIEYYRKRPANDRQARIEELYHRLMLGQAERPVALLDDLVTDEAILAGHAAEPSAEKDMRPVWNALAKDADELPPSGVGYLAARLQREMLTDAEWDLVHRDDFELMLLGRATRLVRSRGSTWTALVSLENGIGHLTGLKALPSLEPTSPLHIARMALCARMAQLEHVERLAAQTLGPLQGPSAPVNVITLRRQGEIHLLAAGPYFDKQPAAGIEHLRAAQSIYRELIKSEEGRQTGLRLARQWLRIAVNRAGSLAPQKSAGRGSAEEVADMVRTRVMELSEFQLETELSRRPALVHALADFLLSERHGPRTVERLMPPAPPAEEWLRWATAPFLPSMHERDAFLRDLTELLREQSGSPDSLWNALTREGIIGALLKQLADAIPPGADLQSEAAAAGDLMPGEATNLSADAPAANAS